MRSKSISILTSGSIASTPRMLKAADALHEEGYAVRVVHAEIVDWADEMGRAIAASRPWRSDLIEWRSRDGRFGRHLRAIAHGTARKWTDLAPRLTSDACLELASCKAAGELARSLSREKSDLIYAGTAGGLAVAARAARRLEVPYALDIEDLHSAEQADGSNRHTANRIASTVLARVLPGAAFVTTSSELLGLELSRRYSVDSITIHNTFTLPPSEPSFASAPGPLRLFWFSQTIGAGRGIEEVLAAVELLERPLRLGLMGRETDFSREIARRASRIAGLDLEILPPRHPDEIVEECGNWDVGLALERHVPLNRDITLSNKIFTYPLAGLAIIATGTDAVRRVAPDFGEGLFLYEPGDTTALASRLSLWSSDPDALLRAKKASWAAARDRWNWNAPSERGSLVAAVGRVMRGS